MSKLLIVDDEEATVDMLSTYLELIGHETIGAFSGTDGLSKAISEQPDLLLLDLMMPDLEGYDVCRQLRSEESFLQTPILIISARIDRQSIDLAMSAGADAYLTKPLDLPKLTSEITRLLADPPQHTLPDKNSTAPSDSATTVSEDVKTKKQSTNKAKDDTKSGEKKNSTDNQS